MCTNSRARISSPAAPLRRRKGPGWRVLAALLMPLLAAACSQQMANQPKYKPLDPSAFFANGMSSRPLLPDTVARGELKDDTQLFTGKSGGADAATFPYPVTREMLQRGQQRFNVFCAPCHGELGAGNGMVVQRGFTAPPTFHSDRLRNAPVGHFFDVITNGLGAMPAYADQIPVRDRWAIVAYIRALQLSQDATYDDVPPDVRATLGPPPLTTVTPSATATPTPGSAGATSTPTPTGAAAP